RSISRVSLHVAALAGDVTGVTRALMAGADINATDDRGRTALVCAIGGANWERVDGNNPCFMTPQRLNAIRVIVEHSEISLFTLNAPQPAIRGVTPLGLACWLNMYEVVRLLVENSEGAVCVDSVDIHRATPLMYCARDGSFKVVQFLLQHEARPDFRDRNYISAIHFARPHPQILWLCEARLRRHRWREAMHGARASKYDACGHILEIIKRSFTSSELNPPPLSLLSGQAMVQTTDTLIQAVVTSDLPLVLSMLFPSRADGAMRGPVLVNNSDAQGWSPIHHCVSSQLNIEMLDALYLAGADVALTTVKEKYTPLHCLARSRNITDVEALYGFAFHLIRDLRVPLGARDSNNETCMHIAARIGTHLELLLIFLQCDSTHAVREMRNGRGLTAFDVAKPAFHGVFAKQRRPPRTASPPPLRTLQHKASMQSFLDLYDRDNDLVSTTEEFLTEMNRLSPKHVERAGHRLLEDMADTIGEMSDLSQRVFAQARQGVDNAARTLVSLRSRYDDAGAAVDSVSGLVRATLKERGIEPFRSKKHIRGSQDSQMTTVPGKLKARLLSSLLMYAQRMVKQKDTSSSRRKIKAWFKRKVALDSPTRREDVARGTVTPVPREMVVDHVLQSAPNVLDTAAHDLVGIAQYLSSIEAHIELAQHSLDRAERCVKRGINKRSEAISERLKQLNDRPSSLRRFVPPSLAVKSSERSLAPSFQSAWSTFTSNEIAAQDDDDVKLIRRLLLRKMEGALAGAASDIRKSCNWLRVVKEVTVGVKRR
ncbi:hypothetical protein FISHEDRAFT_9706, partial [Fistulina hepatica ATCC 64428]